MLDLSKAVVAGQQTHVATPKGTERIIRAALTEIIEALAEEAQKRYENAEVCMARYEADEFYAAAEYLRRRAGEVR